MTQGIFHTTCPSCGGPVHSYSASAKTLVCPYCRSLLIRDGASVSDSGELLLESEGHPLENIKSESRSVAKNKAKGNNAARKTAAGKFRRK